MNLKKSGELECVKKLSKLFTDISEKIEYKFFDFKILYKMYCKKKVYSNNRLYP